MARKKKPHPDPVTADSASVPPEPATPAGEAPSSAPHPQAAAEPPVGEPSHVETARPDGPRVPNPFGFRQDAVAGVRLLENRRFKQMQLRFAVKPSDEVRAAVADAGWKWRQHEEHWTKQIDAAKGWQTRADADALYERVVTMIRSEMGMGVERA